MRHEVEATIETIGARGDGIATVEGTRIFVPCTVPGDRIVARLGEKRDEAYGARLLRIVAPGPGRGQPACRHFGLCGGCALQHLDDEHYRAWKRQLVIDALARRGLPTEGVEALRPAVQGTRRRADLTAVRRADDLLLGLNERGTHRVVGLDECPVLESAIVAALEPLRRTLRLLFTPGERAEVVINALGFGLDVLLVTTAAFGQGARKRLTELAETLDLARLSRRHPEESRAETIIERRPATIRFADVAVAVPAGAFLQATEGGERDLVNVVLDGVQGAKRVADLYAGCGTFTFPIAAAGASVHAVDGAGALIGALDAAAKAAKRRAVSTAMRDLDRSPLPPDALNAYDAVVFDPPRAGARAQAESLARSRVPVIVAVSCEPQTFARDARILADGGYTLARIVPVDQFLWSPRIELAAVFRR
ncbi:MAG: class I SAM-dependent RNA methyltransferase [Alphaproteobacteria bacterium]